MKITTYTGGFVQTNAYLIETTAGNLLIDAPEGVADWVRRKGVRVDDVLLTHQHYDHVTDAAAMKAGGARLHGFAPYSTELTLESAARAWGMPISVEPYEIDGLLDVTQPLCIAGMEVRLAHVPGHATDSVIFHFAGAGVVFSGDTLFAGSIGRTDLPGGSTSQLLAGIDRHLMTLPPATRVFPGHGPETTIAAEAAENPYLE
jgi:glyoxylase-like metal-dependent hydrolase (beta-lactamase superfamily II)